MKMSSKIKLGCAGIITACSILILCYSISVAIHANKVLDTEPLERNYTVPLVYDGKSPDTYTTGSGDSEAFVTYLDYDTADVPVSAYTLEYSTHSNSKRGIYLTPEMISLITADEDTAWNVISGSVYKAYPKTSFASNAALLQSIRESYSTKITVNVWTWQSNNPNDLTKTPATLTLEVNNNLKDIWLAVFREIYEDPTKPVINTRDSGMGTWVNRGKNHNPYNTMSAHALGTAIDINPSTGSFNVNKVTYGNGYGQKAISYDSWSKLPDTQSKYNMLYTDSPIVQIFKAYGFYWGGDWSSGTDCMHLSFLGDGSNAREIGSNNYKQYAK